MRVSKILEFLEVFFIAVCLGLSGVILIGTFIHYLVQHRWGDAVGIFVLVSAYLAVVSILLKGFFWHRGC